MNMKALFLLALTIFAAVSTVATAIAFNMSTPNSFSITKTIAKTIGSRDIQPTGGDPVDDPVLPS